MSSANAGSKNDKIALRKSKRDTKVTAATANANNSVGSPAVSRKNHGQPPTPAGMLLSMATMQRISEVRALTPEERGKTVLFDGSKLN